MNHSQFSRQTIAVILVMLWAAPLAHGAVLESDTAVATAGFFRLSWESAEPVRLVESRDSDFAERAVVYAGADTARVVSGKPDGDWHYRLEEVATGRVAGQPVTVTVQHHTLRKAWTFFAIGAVVFLATVGLIISGGRAGGGLNGGAG